MFSYVIKKIRALTLLLRQAQTPKNKKDQQDEIPEKLDKTTLILNSMFSGCSNFTKRKIAVAGEKRILIVYIQGLVDNRSLELAVLKPIFEMSGYLKQHHKQEEISVDTLKQSILLSGNIIEINRMSTVIQKLYAGFIMLFMDNEKIALGIDAQESYSRSISHSDMENVIRGPREGFVESAPTNLALITARIRNPDFKSEILTLGSCTNTLVYICYLKGIAKKGIVNKVRKRLKKINIDAVLDSNYLQEYINDNPFTIFPLIGNHEKPDIIAAQILEGRVAVICDGSPIVLTMPFLFIEAIQSSEDYYNKPFFASFIRVIRFLALMITTMLPSLYVAFLNFHHEVTPFGLLITTAASQEKIPLSSFSEAVLMGAAFELLREAGIRMPKGIGQTVSIVGALILGESAVRAGFVSNLIVIVVALTAICSFVNSSLLDTMSVLRLGSVFIANFFGFTGIFLLFVFVYIHMCSLTSFGVPYMSPISPLSLEGLKDTLVRFPLQSMKTRPKVIAKNGKRRGR